MSIFDKGVVCVWSRPVIGDPELVALFYDTNLDSVRLMLKKRFLELVDLEFWTSSEFVKGEKGVPDEKE